MFKHSFDCLLYSNKNSKVTMNIQTFRVFLCDLQYVYINLSIETKTLKPPTKLINLQFCFILLLDRFKDSLTYYLVKLKLYL